MARLTGLSQSSTAACEVAEYLLIRHNTAVELTDRAEQVGLLARYRDPVNHRLVRLRLTPLGRGRLAALSSAHIEELAQLSSVLESAINDLAAS